MGVSDPGCDPAEELSILSSPAGVLRTMHGTRRAGCERFHFPDAVVTYDPRNFLLVTVPVPANCEALVGVEGPSWVCLSESTCRCLQRCWCMYLRRLRTRRLVTWRSALLQWM